MSILTVYHHSNPDVPDKVLTHPENICATLAVVGVHFERWQSGATLQPGASEEDVVAAYRPQIDTLTEARGDVRVDVISIDRKHPQKDELRARFLDEHYHDEDEVRFVVAGRGLFSLHIGDHIYAVLCERHDLIRIPAGTRHWFDMGEFPHLVAIRLFNNAEGLVAHFTGDDIARHFPRLED